MAFKGRDPVGTEIVMDNRIIEKLKLFNCLGNVISYGKELDIDNKLRNYEGWNFNSGNYLFNTDTQ